MAEVIKFVHGDTAPQLKLTISDSVTGTTVNLTTYTVTVYIRPVGSTSAPIRTKIATKSDQSTSPGQCIISWEVDDLKLATGSYEAEVELVSSSSRETIYDLLTFYVRGEIGPTPLSDTVV